MDLFYWFAFVVVTLEILAAVIITLGIGYVLYALCHLPRYFIDPTYRKTRKISS